MKIVLRWLASLAILALALVLPASVVYAQAPHSFYGTVKINDHDAPTGTVITAKFGEVVCGTYTTTEDGQYGDVAIADYLVVWHATLHENDTINFYVNGVDTTQSEAFIPGALPTSLNLTVSIPFYLASYSNAAYTTSCNNFQSYATQHIVYMYGTNVTADHNYRVAYYDGGNDKRATEDKPSSSSGNLTSQHTFVPGTDVEGTWHFIVCETTYSPESSYNATWQYTLASDTFTVQASAIPEFPTALVAIVSLSLCAGIYLWLRRKTALVPTS